MTVHARFDGKVIIPDEPLDLAPDQAIVVDIQPAREAQPVNGQDAPEDESATSWIIAHAIDSDDLPTDLSVNLDYYLYGRLLGK